MSAFNYTAGPAFSTDYPSRLFVSLDAKMETLPAYKSSGNRATIEAVVFDLDGTLVDSNDFHVEAWDRAFRQFGKEFRMSALRDQIGKGSDQYLPEFLTPLEIEKFGKQLDQYRSALFRKEFLPRVKAFPKVRELFQRIKADGRRIALATSSHEDDAKTYTDIANITDLVDCQTSADDTEESKPSPDIFQAALDQLGASAEVAIAVGDTRFDVEAANRIELKTVGFLCGRAADEQTLREAGAIAIYQDPADLLANYDDSPLGISVEKSAARAA